MLIRFQKSEYVPPGVVLKLSREEHARRPNTVAPISGRAGWYRVEIQTAFVAGTEIEMREVPASLMASGAVELIPLTNKEAPKGKSLRS